MLLKRYPPPSLRPFVKTLWVTDQTNEPRTAGPDREHVLPTGGHVHLVFRLYDQPLRLFDDAGNATGRFIKHAVVGGPRSTFYVRDISQPACSAGVQLLPGAAEILFGVPADELAERHTALDDFWGRAANSAREQILEATTPEQKMDVLVSLLAARLPTVRALHPAVAQALEQFWTITNIREVVLASGYSHRQFVALFRRAVGLSPKLYCRILRFQKVLGRLAAEPAASCVDLALDAGYSDQSHFTREFREFAGLTPERYRNISPSLTHHVPIILPKG